MLMLIESENEICKKHVSDENLEGKVEKCFARKKYL